MLRILSIFLGFFALSFSSHANFAYDDFQLIVRANFTDGHQIPPMSYISNASPVINDRGDVAIKALGVAGESVSGVWYRAHNQRVGQIVYTGPQDRLLSDVGLNSRGELAFAQYDFGVTDGVFVYYPGLGVSLAVDPKDFPGAQAFSFPEISDRGEVSFRRLQQSGARDYVAVSGEQRSRVILREGEGVSYIFTPSLNGNYRVVKVRLGDLFDYTPELPDEIRLYNDSNTGHIVVARDQDADGNSLFVDFDNSPAVSDNGQVAFIARMADDRKRAIYRWRDGELKELAREGHELSEIEYFGPTINNQGTVVLRAKDLEGRRAIFAFGADAKMTRIIGEGDPIISDRETARVLDREGFPGFSGKIDLNNHNQLVFHAVLEAKDGSEYMGNAVYQIDLERMNAL